jgi:ApbE superfamily uncharacterized protein (UPF0280 family)
MLRKENMMLTFTFNIQDTNVILNALAAQPYTAVASIISSLQAQAQEQINNNPEILASKENTLPTD